MNEKLLTTEQRLQIARMAADIVAAGINTKTAAYYFTNKLPGPRTSHELFNFVYDAIVERITAGPETD